MRKERKIPCTEKLEIIYTDTPASRLWSIIHRYSHPSPHVSVGYTWGLASQEWYEKG